MKIPQIITNYHKKHIKLSAQNGRHSSVAFKVCAFILFLEPYSPTRVSPFSTANYAGNP